MSRYRCEICDTPVHEMDFSFRLPKGLVCSSCVVQYGFRVASEDTAALEPDTFSDALLPPADLPADTIRTQLPERPDMPEIPAVPSFVL